MADDKAPVLDNLDDLKEDQSDLDILNSETSTDDKEVEDEGKETTEKDETETEDELPDEETGETEKEDEEELPETKLRPSIKTITKEFPEAEKIFKKYPQLRDAYFREGKFSQLFPSIEDAAEASVKAESLDSFNELLMGGSVKEIFEAIKQDSPEAMSKIAKNLLPQLAQVDDKLFYEASIPVVNTVVRNLYNAGLKNKDNNMMGAAKIMAHFLHGTYDIPPAESKVTDPEVDKERKQLQDERLQHERELYKEFDTNLNNRVSKFLTKTIEDGLDPTNSLSSFTKSKIVEEIIQRVGTEMEKDRSHMVNIEKLWKQARAERFSSKAADRIISAYLSRAKPLIPEIRSKVKNEALGSAKRKNGNERRSTSRDISTGTRTSERGASDIPTNPKKADRNFWKSHSDIDILK